MALPLLVRQRIGAAIDLLKALQPHERSETIFRAEARNLYFEIQADMPAAAIGFASRCLAEFGVDPRVHPVGKVENGAAIVSAQHVGDAPGVRICMGDGSVWFHPYGGGAPVCEKPAGQTPEVFARFETDSSPGVTAEPKPGDATAKAYPPISPPMVATKEEPGVSADRLRVAGTRRTYTDGSVWFYPCNGAREPVQERPADAPVSGDDVQRGLPDTPLCFRHGKGWRPAVIFKGRTHIWAGEYETADAAVGVARSLLAQANKIGYVA